MEKFVFGISDKELKAKEKTNKYLPLEKRIEKRIYEIKNLLLYGYNHGLLYEENLKTFLCLLYGIELTLNTKELKLNNDVFNTGFLKALKETIMEDLMERTTNKKELLKALKEESTKRPTDEEEKWLKAIQLEALAS